MKQCGKNEENNHPLFLVINLKLKCLIILELCLPIPYIQYHLISWLFLSFSFPPTPVSLLFLLVPLIANHPSYSIYPLPFQLSNLVIHSHHAARFYHLFYLHPSLHLAQFLALPSNPISPLVISF